MCSFISDVLGLGKKAVEKTSNTTVETSLKGVRGYYNLKMKTINTISKLKPEWRFIDVATIKNNIKNIEDDYKNIMSMYQCKAEALDDKKIIRSKFEVEKNNIIKQLDYYRQNGNIKEYERENERLRQLNLEIEEINKEVNKLDIEKDELNKKVKDLCWRVIWAKSQLKDTYGESKKLAEIYCLKDDYVFYGLKSIGYYYEGRYEESYNTAIDYYLAVNGNLDKNLHPVICYHVSKYLLDVGKYLEAKEYIDFLIAAFPDNIEYHRLLLYFYNTKGTERDIRVQKEIIDMLT